MNLKRIIGISVLGGAGALTTGCGSDSPDFEIGCERDNIPACGKIQIGNVCEAEPCESHVYTSFENSCEANEQDVLVSFRDYCDEAGIGNQLTYHHNPVKLFGLNSGSSAPTPLPRSEGINILDAEINGDILKVTLGYSGCSEQNIDLNIDAGAILTSLPLQVNYAFSKETEDLCDAAFQSEFEYDLLPIRGAFRSIVEGDNGLAVIGIGGPIYKREPGEE